MWGQGICRVRSRNWITFDHLTDKITPSEVNLASEAHKWHFGSKTSTPGISRFDLRKKEKNATKHAAQKARSKLQNKLSLVKIFPKISKVIGSFCFDASPLTRRTPLRIEDTYQFPSSGLASPASTWSIRTILRYWRTELKHNLRDKYAM